jgi:hypothetical protein
MKIYFWILLLSTLSSCALSQNARNQVQVDFDRKFVIDKEDSLYRTTYHGPKEKIKADLVIEGIKVKDPQRIKSSWGQIKGDTVEIQLYNTSPGFYHEYVIKIWKTSFNIAYNYKTSGDPHVREIITDSATLVLNTKRLKKGQTIRGHTEYRGRCTKGCGIEEYKIAGNFAVVLE